MTIKRMGCTPLPGLLEKHGVLQAHQVIDRRDVESGARKEGEAPIGPNGLLLKGQSLSSPPISGHL